MNNGGSEDHQQEDNPHSFRTEAYYRNHGRAELQPAVCLCMLYGMAALVGSHCSCSNGITVIYCFTEVYGFIRRVIVIRQPAGGGNDLYIVDAVVVKHLFRD